MRRGFSMVELLVVLAIVGILAAIVVPAAGRASDRFLVEQEATRIVLAYRQAWAAARSRQRIAILRITPDSIAVRAVLPGTASDTILVLLEPGPRAAGVELRSPPHTAQLGPDGIGTGATNATHFLVKGSAARRIVVSRLGRVRVQ